MFDGFKHVSAVAGDVPIHAIQAGRGPALLLLHGHPQTHAIWHKVAPALAEHFTVVAADLRGYGDSGKPLGDADHANYAKRRMALDQVELMHGLGHESFAVIGHDRGARVAVRMALDHPRSVTRLVTLDIAPTLAMYEQTSLNFARRTRALRPRSLCGISALPVGPSDRARHLRGLSRVDRLRSRP